MESRSAAIVAAGIVLGAALGLGGFTFIYARGYSYLIDDPAACANCHVMQAHYDAWVKSPHHAVAGCNGCHTPPGFFAKYAAKGLNGFLHSAAFTTGVYPDPLRIKGFNRAITEAACRNCHGALVADVDHGSAGMGAEGGALRCASCHAGAGHRR